MKFAKYIAAFLGAAAISAAVTAASAAETAYICVNNKWLDDASSGMVVSGTTLVPIRAVNDNLGLATSWDGTERCVTIDFGDGRQCDMYIGGYYAYMHENDGIKEYRLSSPPVIMADRTYVPIRFISEAMNKFVRWEGGKRLVFIDSERAYADYLNDTIGGGAQTDEEKAQNLLNLAATRYNNGDFYEARDALEVLTAAGYSMTDEQRMRLVDFTSRVYEAVAAWEQKLAEEADLGDTLFDGGSVNFTYYTKNWNVKDLYSNYLRLERDGDYIVFEITSAQGSETGRDWLNSYELSEFNNGYTVDIISGPDTTDLPDNGRIGGLRAYQITYTTEKNNTKTLHKTVVVQNGGIIYRFAMTTGRDDWRKEQYEYFDSMMSSTAFE